MTARVIADRRARRIAPLALARSLSRGSLYGLQRWWCRARERAAHARAAAAGANAAFGWRTRATRTSRSRIFWRRESSSWRDR